MTVNAIQDSYVPYQTIERLAADATLLKAVSNRVFERFTGTFLDNPSSLTNCALTVHTLAILFLGFDKAKAIMERVNSSRFLQVAVPIAELPWFFTIRNLFVGPLLCQGSDLMALDAHSKAAEPFFTHMHPIINRESLTVDRIEEYLSNVDYDFNAPVLNSLKERLLLNKNRVTSLTSIVYCVVIQMPSKTKVSELEIYHAFVIEQYCSPSKNSIYYRIYQSCQNVMTLIQHFQKCGYSLGDEGCFTDAEIVDFLNDVQLCISKDARAKTVRERRFGFPQDLDIPITSFNRSTRTLEGLSLRYECSEIHPSNCQNNLQAFLID